MGSGVATKRVWGARWGYMIESVPCGERRASEEVADGCRGVSENKIETVPCRSLSTNSDRVSQIQVAEPSQCVTVQTTEPRSCHGFVVCMGM